MYTDIFILCLIYKLRKKNWWASDDDWKLRRTKQNSVNTCTYIGILSHKVWLLKSILFLRSRRNKVFCLGTGNRQTQVLKVNCIKYYLYTCPLYFIVHRAHYKCQKNYVNLINSSICLKSFCVDRKRWKTKWNQLNTFSIKCLSSMKVLCFDHI